MSQLSVYQRFLIRRILPVVNRRLVSTSNKSQDAVAECKTPVSTSKPLVKDQNWIHYGWDANSKEDDRRAMHSVMFAAVTLCLVVGGFYIAYLPDYHLRDWAQREAFLELKRREASGRPLVDPNFIDPSRIVLPSDEELGNTEIII